MVDFVRPNFLGTRTEFGNMFERPIQNGQCVDSNPADFIPWLRVLSNEEAMQCYEIAFHIKRSMFFFYG
jgi:hypothetical protein